MNNHVVLASSSPRRYSMLEGAGLDVTVRILPIDESLLEEETAEQAVLRLAMMKAKRVSEISLAHEVVIAADTLVSSGHKILGKPREMNEYLSMIELLANATHHVFTGVCLLTHHHQHSFFTSTAVEMGDISQEARKAYWLTQEPIDKAGGYAIQGLGAAFIKRVEGSYTGVVGLPLQQTLEALQQHFQVSPWL